MAHQQHSHILHKCFNFRIKNYIKKFKFKFRRECPVLMRNTTAHAHGVVADVSVTSFVRVSSCVRSAPQLDPIPPDRSMSQASTFVSNIPILNHVEFLYGVGFVQNYSVAVSLDRSPVSPMWKIPQKKCFYVILRAGMLARCSVQQMRFMNVLRTILRG